MCRVIQSIVLCFGLASLAMAGSYTFTTTAAEDTVISRMRTFANTNNLFGAPYATDTLFVNAMCRQHVLLVRDQARAQSDSFENAWAAATPTTRDNICTAAPPNGLGLAAGCKP